MSQPTKNSRPGIFVGWLLVFYSVWSMIVITQSRWSDVRANWPIAFSMAGGSFVAGSSPVAGGTIGFPVLVYLFNHPAKLGRNFSLAIQSIGMVSASIYILTRGRRLEWRLLRFAILGSALATPIGVFWIAPHLADVWIKLLFSVVYASFGLLHLFRLRTITANEGPSRTRFAADPIIGVAVGALGGLLSAIIGVGADILLYGTLVLLYHADVKVAIPTAVVLMAFTSVVGAACAILATLGSPGAGPSMIDVFPYWLAAAPVVAIGGPLGSLVSRFVSRRAILAVVAVLCLVQYAWTCYHEHIVGWSLAFAAVGVLLTNLVLHLLYMVGRRALPVDG
jgi:uncharacterized membrane protein YfcA